MALSDDAPSRLLTLPADVQQEIFGWLSPIDITIFSFCSKGSFQVAKSVKKPQKMEFEIYQVAEGGYVYINYPRHGRFEFLAISKDCDEKTNSCGKNYYQVVGNESAKFVVTSTHGLQTCWNDEIQGFVDLVKHLMEIFSIGMIMTVRTCSSYGKREALLPPGRFDIYSGTHYRSMLDWLHEEYKGEIFKMEFETIHQANYSDLIYLLDRAKMAKTILDFYTYLSPNLEYQFNYDVDTMKIGSGSWINFDNLVQLSQQVRRLTIFKSSFTNICLNQFIKKWLVTGEELKLKTFEVHLRGEDVDMKIVLDGITHDQFECKEHFFSRKEKSFIKKGYVVRRRSKKDKLIISTEVRNSRQIVMYIAPFKKGQDTA